MPVPTAKIVTFCDSDGIVSKNFVASIIESFDQDRNIVLHMDQVRNGEEKYYPFNYPSLEEVITRRKKYIVHCAGSARRIRNAPAAKENPALEELRLARKNTDVNENLLERTVVG